MSTNLRATVKELGDVTGKSDSCGWMFDEVAWLLHAFVIFIRPEIVIQTGHLWGKSACMILHALRYQMEIEGNTPQGDAAFDTFVHSRIAERPSFGQLISVDPGGYAKGGYDWLTEHFPGQFKHYQITSADFFEAEGKRLKDEYAGKEVFGVVDGDHSIEGCRKDLLALIELGARVIFVDDTEWLKELCDVSREVATANGYQFINLNYLNGVALLVRS